MFHFAEPEEAGFGVMILTPGLTRSSQRLDVLGVALADHDHHDGLGEDALGRGLASSRRRPAWRRRASCTSGSRERCTIVGLAGRRSTARLWSPEAPYDVLELDVLAGGGLLEVGDDLLVGLLEDGEADHARRRRLPADAPLELRSRRPAERPVRRRRRRRCGLPLDAHVCLVSVSVALGGKRRTKSRMSSRHYQLTSSHFVIGASRTCRACRPAHMSRMPDGHVGIRPAPDDRGRVARP